MLGFETEPEDSPSRPGGCVHTVFIPKPSQNVSSIPGAELGSETEGVLIPGPAVTEHTA